MIDRISMAETTWHRIQPILRRVGVTRIAEITWLDEVGIPCVQAIRPNARTLSVAQGKGATVLLASLSAAMEAIEVWHAERIEPPQLFATTREVANVLNYPLNALRLAERNYLNSGTRLGWTPASEILTRRKTLVPTASLRLDSRVDETWEPVLFDVTSNGLSSGISRSDAILHGLFEVIERDALAQAGKENTVRVETSSISDLPAELMARFQKAGVELEIEMLTTRFGVPCFRARAFSEDFPVDFCGTGADADPGKALCQALTEAAQSRVAAIAGTREDLGSGLYQENFDLEDRPAQKQGRPSQPLCVEPLDLPDDLDLAVAALASEVLKVTGHQPLVVDHTLPGIGIPVVRVVCPGMSCPNDY
ncbi:YcaO-like family protein [Streptomyces olivaceus]|uniref:YcaO-like family protein n=1 Tax=Streptomyces olivaceus TaxID=47716 RepID=UPI0036C64AE8